MRGVAIRDPDACPIHGTVSDSTCAHCAPIAIRLSVILLAIEQAPEQRAVTPAARRRYAEIVLQYAASDYVGSAGIPQEHQRALDALKRAARWSAAAELAR